MNTRIFSIRLWAVIAVGFAITLPLFASLPPGLHIVRSTQQELVLRYTPTVRSWSTTYTQSGAPTLIPDIEGSTLLAVQQGSPSWLGIQVPVTVPAPDGFEVQSVSVRGTQRKNALITPVMLSSSMDERPQQAPVLGEQYFQVPAPEWARVQYRGISRDKHLAYIILTAARFQPEQKIIEIPQEILLTLRFHPQNNTTSTTANAATDDLLLSINAKETANWRIPPQQNILTAKGNTTQSNSDISSGTWLKIKVSQEGIYKIDAQQLQQAGVTIPKEEINSIKIFGGGGAELSEVPSSAIEEPIAEQAIEVKVKSSDGNLDAIIFYGAAANGFQYTKSAKLIEHYLNRYSNDNYYLLTWGGRNGKRMVATPPPTGAVENRPTQYTARLFNDEELINPYGAGSGRRWFGKIIDSFSPRTYTTVLPNLSRSGKVQYRFLVAHKIGEQATVSISENNNPLSSLTLLPKNDGNYDEFQSNQTVVSIDAAKIASDNRSNLKFSYAALSGNSGASGYVDFFEIHYPAEMAAINNQIEFVSDLGLRGVTEYAFNQFSGDVIGFDISDRARPVRLTNIATTGGMFTFRTLLDQDSPKRFFMSGSYQKADIQRINFANLNDEVSGADLIVVVPEEFRSTAEKYKEYRESQGEISVKVASIEDIYNEFGGGVPDITALRNYFAHAYHTWKNKPRYVLLWGDGHFDYRNISTKRPNYIPTWQTDDINYTFNTSIGWSYISSYSTEDYFTYVAGDDNVPDISLGRITADSKESSEWMLEKIKTYETQSIDDQWRTIMTFVADDGPTSSGSTDRNTHTSQSEELTTNTNLVPGDIQEKKIYMVEYPVENIPRGRRKPRVTEDLVSFINNRGAVVLNWIGHGNPRVWAHETIFDREITTPQFTNLKRLFFLVAATCDFARFDMTETQSGAEALVMSKYGGAIGSFSSSRVVYSAPNATLAQELYRQLFIRGSDTRYRRIGDVALNTKQKLNGQNDQKYFLLGDPTMRLLIPDYVVTVDTVNDIATSSGDTVTIKALSTMRVAGRITRFGSDKTETAFNGSAILTLYDSDLILDVVDPAAAASLNDTTTHHFVKLGGALHRGSYKVVNGRFTAQFVVPKDISYLNKFGRMFVYAQSDDKRYAKGETSRFKVGGIADVSLDDKAGPDMRIFMDARTFKPDDIVRSNPLLIVDLFDTTGINSTGIGIGHKIEAWFDDAIESIDLTDDFTTSLTDSRFGSAIKQVFGFTPGRHRVRVRAWDILNNYNEASTIFRVGDRDNEVISGRVEIYPNPFSDNTTIFFTHNQGLRFTAELKIFSIHGQQIRAFRQSAVPELQAGKFEWDGRDEEGSTVAQGIYPFVLYFSAPDGSIDTVNGTIIYLKN